MIGWDEEYIFEMGLKPPTNLVGMYASPSRMRIINPFIGIYWLIGFGVPIMGWRTIPGPYIYIPCFDHGTLMLGYWTSGEWRECFLAHNFDPCEIGSLRWPTHRKNPTYKWTILMWYRGIPVYRCEISMQSPIVACNVSISLGVTFPDIGGYSPTLWPFIVLEPLNL